jgi:uncharacterized protein (TIGR03066 family)
MRLFTAASVLLALAFAVGAAEDKKEEKDKKDKASKIDKAKLVGTWTFVKSDSEKPIPEGLTLKIEFTKDGKFTFTASIKDKESKSDGTYTVDGDQLTTVTKRKDKDAKEVLTIKELTDKKLVVSGKKGDKTETMEFKK